MDGSLKFDVIFTGLAVVTSFSFKFTQSSMKFQLIIKKNIKLLINEESSSLKLKNVMFILHKKMKRQYLLLSFSRSC